ncbi:tyrosine-type recombinase/integrase [Evansella clarkii]|uniref:tyrosine-type recombinase/integrase n=1 Tax=Evansella clarkii TaxID=79879 RepID=UPI000B45018A|nr:tyrosine-type recombinase/integrase [Evansella clarkii]
MEFVDAIRDVKKIEQIKAKLKERSIRDYLLFVIGVNTGLRISQLLKLKLNDVLTAEREPARVLYISPDERGIYLNRNVRNALSHFLEKKELSREDYLFTSTKKGEPLTRQHAYRIVKQAAAEAGIHEHIGTHTLRKTFGYHAFRKGVSLALLQERFHHATPSETLRYIGAKKEDVTIPMIDVNL